MVAIGDDFTENVKNSLVPSQNIQSRNLKQSTAIHSHVICFNNGPGLSFTFENNCGR